MVKNETIKKLYRYIIDLDKDFEINELGRSRFTIYVIGVVDKNKKYFGTYSTISLGKDNSGNLFTFVS